MNIILEKKDNSNASLKVNLTEDDYKPKVEKKLKEYQKKAQIKGFRPGKVPVNLLQKMYGKSIFVEVINEMLGEGVNNYVKENKLPILGEPLPGQAENPIDWDNQKEFDFTFDLGLIPEFTYTSLDKLAVTTYEVEINEQTVDEYIERIRTRTATTTSPEKSEEGDMVFGELKALNGDFNTKTLVPLNKIAESERAAFIGIGSGDVVKFDIRKAFKAEELHHVTGASKEEAAKLEGEFQFTVQNVNRTVLSALDQDFFDKAVGAGQVSSEEEFRAKLKELLVADFKRTTDELLERDLKNQVVAQTTIELPAEFLKRWLLVTNEGKLTEEQINTEFPLYEEDLKWRLISNKVAEAFEVTVNNEDVEQAAKDLISTQFAMMGLGALGEDELSNYASNFLKADKGKNYLNIYEKTYNKRVLDIIRQKADIQTQTVNSEEFEKIVSQS